MCQVNLDIAHKQIQESIEEKEERNNIISNNHNIQVDVKMHIEKNYPSLVGLGLEIWLIENQSEYERMQDFFLYVNDKFEQLDFEGL